MKLFFIVLFVLTVFSFSGHSNAVEKKKGTIIVVVTGFESNDGKARATMFDNPDAFPVKPEKAVRKAVSKIEKNKCTFIFKDVEYGTYAIAIHHDDNGNDEVDTNFLGIPSEDFGASNDATGSFGPPAFEDAAFDLKVEKLSLKIRIQ